MEKGVTVNAAASKTVSEAAVAKPTEKNTVAEIKAYLSENGIEFASSAKKADLLALV
ncbi:HeH/LEM domain-containing protein [Weissella jogaejeotgali]|uniref:HeH/LEM domain-containing protein n=1 Tax=Weissella jogaejeotgali TaxID=1631871 RepID=UPI00214FBFA5|nr:HeH/LEM domain-containing protein [Weissella jogaejeotgali]